MKSMLYVGATLMIGASIYWFVDYNKSSQRKEFKNLYTEEKKTPEVKETPVTVVEKQVIEKQMKGKTGLAVKNKKGETREETTVAIEPISADEKMVTEKTSLPEKTSVTVTPNKESSAIKTVKKKRKISSKLFSRAPLRDEIEEVKLPVKEEAKKTESKEQ